MARVDPLPPQDWPAEMRLALTALRPKVPRHPLPERGGRPKGLNALGLLAHHPALAEAFNTFNGHILLGSTLSARERELIVLRVARRRACAYEWAQHTVLARDAGVGVDEIRRVVAGPEAPGWSEEDATLLRAVDELVDSADLSDETWARLARTRDVPRLLDVVFTVGAYDALAMAFRSFRVELDADLSGNELVVPMSP